MKSRKLWLLATVILSVVVGTQLDRIFSPLAVADAIADKSKTAAPVTDNLKDLFVVLSQRLMPAVVNIYTTQTVANPWGNSQQADLYRRFFENFFGEDFGGPGSPGPGVPQSRKATSLGTGFVIDAGEGLLLTNYHVVSDADEIKIILSEEDREQDGIDAKMVGGDAEADVALLKIKTKRKLTAAPLGDSEALQVGEWVMAIGNPFGHGHTVTKGIISAKERNIPISQFANYIQTDTPINPGNSGGPLINTAGQVIGINTAINANAQGIGFAIPINYVKNILPELRTKGSVTRGFIGVNITEINPILAKQLKLKESVRGVIVSEVFDGEPAQKAGIQPYDVITEVGGKKVTDGRTLVNTISSFAPGAKVKVKILRNGEDKELTLQVGKRPSREAMLNRHTEKQSVKTKINIGMTVEDLDGDLRRELSIPSNVNGVVVVRTTPGGPAEDAQIQRGDLIVEVDQKPVPDTAAFYSLFKEERTYLLRVRRGDGMTILSLDLSSRKK
jgi:serine protease Do